MSDIVSKLAEAQRIVRKNLGVIKTVFPDFYHEASLACDQLVVADGGAYSLMTQVNILVFADQCSHLDAAAIDAKKLVTDPSEFERRFGCKITEAELYMERLESFLSAEQIFQLVHKNVRGAQLVDFLKTNSASLQSLLFELRFPYGKCPCGKAKARKHHSKCSSCYSAEHKPDDKQIKTLAPVIEETTEKVSEMTAMEAAYILAAAQDAEKAEKRKAANRHSYREEEPEFEGGKKKVGRKQKTFKENW